MKILSFIVLIAVIGLLAYATLGLPYRDLTVSASNEKSLSGSILASPYYIKNAYRQTHTPNIVTSILADYRGLDTLGEVTVILAAGMICYLLMRREEKDEERK